MANIGHCPRCDRWWGGHSEAHCPSCHLQFGSTSAFDRHRVGDYATGRRCMTVEEMQTPRVWKGVVGKPSLFAIERKGGTYWVGSLRETAATGASR